MNTSKSVVMFIVMVAVATIFILALMIKLEGLLMADTSSVSPAPSPIETLELEYTVQSKQNGDLILVSPYDRADNRLIEMEEAFFHSLKVNAGDTVYLYVNKHDLNDIISMEGVKNE